ncbi:histidine phosphatase family protein [Lactobacillus sp. ESL0679]|uniref:histidine phosphatase family protein n=1 Tax=Lactobacillus sp. ESL0679 TaxID=2983209 RepID=UPI0023F6F96D|nr:histidine phosphatase family protein [Lactobacillus sp. ESL0679]MDF7683608.1 histidine phosphatase family protein [Lactobacillus sp. ESL0679]
MKELYLMRHGETVFNKRKLIQGAVDSPLTADGIKMAQKMGAYLKKQGLTFDHAYTSTQERASDTLELVTKQPYERLKGLKEWDFGLFEAQPQYLLPKFTFKDPAEASFFVPYGGESTQQVMARMQKTLSKIMARPKHQRVLVVSHGLAMWMFLANFMSFAEMAEKVKDMPNCCVLRLGYDAGKFTFEQIIDVRNLPE